MQASQQLQDKTEQLQQLWYQDPIVIATIIIAIATVAYVLVSIALWRATKRSTEITQKIFEAANRPYIGTEGVKTRINELEGFLRFEVEIKNFGTVPASNLTGGWDILYNGELLPIVRPQRDASILLPQGSIFLVAQLADPQFQPLADGEARLELRLSFRYTGVTDHEYQYRERYEFVRDLRGFASMGGEII